MDGKPKEQPRIQLQGLEQLQIARFIALHELQKKQRLLRTHHGPGRKSILTVHKNLPSRMFNPPYQEAGEPTRQQRRYAERCTAKLQARVVKVETRRVKRLNRSNRKKEIVH